MKRVLIFSLAYFPYVGGAEVAIKELTDRIAPEDLAFTMLTMRKGDEPHEECVGNVRVIRLGRSGSYLSKILFVPRAALYARRLHRAEPFDLAWAMMTYMVFPLALLRLAGTRIPYVLTLQDGDPFEHVFKRWYIRPLAPLVRYGFRHATAISVLSTYLAGWAKRLGYQGEPVLVPNGAAYARFAQAPPRDFGRAPGEVWLVTSSRLVHKNAVDDVIRALARLPDRIRFLVLGTGVDELALKALAREVGVEGRVRFLGHVSHEELPSYLHACDIFIRPSRTEGFGSSFVEAMAAGLPVIATQEGGIADFLFDAKRNPDAPTTGWAVDKDSPEQIATAIEDIVAHPELVGRVTENAARMVQEKYDWDTVAEQMRKVLQGALGKSAA